MPHRTDHVIHQFRAVIASWPLSAVSVSSVVGVVLGWLIF
jgi:ElaB/YqjD/DUF883 family membrane-anchored ribosome-binding protein